MQTQQWGHQVKIQDVTTSRTLKLDSKSKHYPASLFLSIGTTICIEVNRDEFLLGIMREFGLMLAS